MHKREGPYFLQDQKFIFPTLKMELRKGADSLIQKGVSRQLICEVFDDVCEKVVKKIKDSAVSMKDFDMEDELSKYYATQLSTQLFGSSRTLIANIIVGAVYASGYDYKDIGPYENNIDDFEDGFNLIGIKKVSGGCVDDSFFVEGVAFKPHTVDGSEKLDVVENPKIVVLNFKHDEGSQKMDMSADVSINYILKNHVRRLPNVVLTNQAIDEYSKKVLAERGIYFADLVSEDDLVRVSNATFAQTIIYDHNYPRRIRIGFCKSFQQKKYGNEVFGIFSGCPRGKATIIVLRGNDQFIEEAEEYVGDLIPEVRCFMRDCTLVAGGPALYHNIIQHVCEEANHADEDSKPIIKVFSKAIQAVADKTYGVVGSNPSQKHAVAPGVGDIVREPPSVKICAIRLAVQQVCYALKYFK